MKMNNIDAFVEKLHHFISTKDPAIIGQILGDGFILHTPRFLRPISDRTHALAILNGIVQVIPDISYHRIWKGDTEVVCEFRGHVRGTDVIAHGIDVFTLGEDGRAIELSVFIRPTKALEAIGLIEDDLVRKALAAAAPAPAPAPDKV